jgi:hypothetical protein
MGWLRAFQEGAVEVGYLAFAYYNCIATITGLFLVPREVEHKRLCPCQPVDCGDSRDRQELIGGVLSSNRWVYHPHPLIRLDPPPQNLINLLASLTIASG